VQVDIRQQRREYRALRRPLFRRLDQAIFQNAALEHPGDQANDPWVANPVAQKLEHPRMINLVEKSS
jgi:hypothetical protein